MGGIRHDRRRIRLNESEGGPAYQWANGGGKKSWKNRPAEQTVGFVSKPGWAFPRFGLRGPWLSQKFDGIHKEKFKYPKIYLMDFASEEIHGRRDGEDSDIYGEGGRNATAIDS